MKHGYKLLLFMFVCVSIPTFAAQYCCTNHGYMCERRAHSETNCSYRFPDSDVNEACVSFCLDYEHSLRDCMKACTS